MVELDKILLAECTHYAICAMHFALWLDLLNVSLKVAGRYKNKEKSERRGNSRNRLYIILDIKKLADTNSSQGKMCTSLDSTSLLVCIEKASQIIVLVFFVRIDALCCFHAFRHCLFEEKKLRKEKVSRVCFQIQTSIK